MGVSRNLRFTALDYLEANWITPASRPQKRSLGTMNPMIIPKAALDDWVRLLRSSYRVVAPKPLHGQHVFGEVTSASEFDLGYPTSVLPPKKYLYPARENLLRFSTDAQQVEATLDGPRTVVLGVHTCDLHAMQLLDRVMATGFSDQDRKSVV